MKYFLDSKTIFYNNFSPLYWQNDEVENKISSFSSLSFGWNYGEGELISQLVISKAIELYSYGKANGFSGDAFPMINGSINLSLYINEHALDIIINNDFKIDIEYQKGLGQEYEIVDEKENADYADIYLLLNEIRTACLLLESYQSIDITIEVLNDFKALHSSTPQEVEFQSLISNVQQIQLPMGFASTSDIIMNK